MPSTPDLSIIAHATKGSDSIEKGIHLRWGFNHKLGFPPGGFMLYRRKSDLNNRICLDFAKATAGKLPLPYTYKPQHPRHPSLTIESKSSGSLVLEDKAAPSGQILRGLNMGKGSSIRFSPATPQIELLFLIFPKTTFTVSAFSGNRRIHSQTISGRAGLRSIAIDTYGADRLLLEGSGIWLSTVCFWVCDAKGANPWEGPINGDCGFGLPVNQDKRTYYLEKYFSGECDTDWTQAACRLGPSQCDLKGHNFDDLKDVLRKMDGDGIHVPVGWNVMDLVDESPCPGQDGDSPGMRISPYDLILMQCQNPSIAKAVGLYWIDRSAADNEYYDYKVVADWPADPKTLWKLDNEITFEDWAVGHTVYHTFFRDHCIFQGNRGEVVGRGSALARVNRGITFGYPGVTEIRMSFVTPVKEVQLFLSQEGRRGRVTAISATGNLLDVSDFTGREEVVSIHSENLSSLVIQGMSVVIHRVHYDHEFLDYGPREAVICGVMKRPEKGLPAPAGLKATCLRGSVTETDEDCNEVQKRFRVGLRWNLPGGEESGIFSGAATGYLVERTDPRGAMVQVTDNSPVHVVPLDPQVQVDVERLKAEQQPVTQKDCAGNDINGRQYFEDSVVEKGRYEYRVAATDLFGRQSPFSRRASVLLLPPKPPHPVDMEAKFIDLNSYNATDDTFADINLSASDKAWLMANNTSAIVVRWRWSETLREQIPDARSFRVHFLGGWLNLIKGTVTGVTNIAGGYKLNTELLENLTANSLAGEWIRQGKFIYKVKSNTAGVNSNITVFTPPGYLGLEPEEKKPRANEPFLLPLTLLTNPDGTGGAGKNYHDPLLWGAPIYEQAITSPNDEEYRVYIPYPAFEISDADAQNEKTRSGQVGVSTVTDEGEGSVSPPATIMSVYWKVPPEQTFVDAPGLKATAADVFGKSSYPLRWPRPAANSRLKYYVYRTMDETLFGVDRKIRDIRPKVRNNAFYDAALSDLGIGLGAADLANFRADEPDYSTYNNNMLKALGSLAGNEEAFSKLNEKPIDPEKPEYTDRRIPGEPPYMPNAAAVLYEDSTLDGRAANRYLYRIRAVNEIGGLSAFGAATLPVEAPRVTPPVAPTITKVEGGDRQITVAWSPRPGAGIVGYLVYRTDEERKAGDWRTMTLLKQNPADPYSLDIPDPVPADFRYEYVDDTVEPRKKYYYGIAAVDGDGLRSRLSPVKTSQAYDTMPPEAPMWISQNRSGDNTSVILEWSSNRPFACIVKRRQQGGGVFFNVSSWLVPSNFDEASNLWIYRLEDQDLEPGTPYIYLITIRNDIGLKNDSETRTV